MTEPESKITQLEVPAVPENLHDAHVICVHGYWLSILEKPTANQKAILSFLGRLTVEATVDLYKEAVARGQKVIILETSGHAWGENYEAVSHLMKKSLEEHGIEGSNIFTVDYNRATKGEIRTIQEFIKFNHLTQEPDVLAVEQHMFTIQEEYKKHPEWNQRMNFIIVEDVIEKRGSQAKKLIALYRKSIHMRAYKGYEGFKRLLVKTGLSEKAEQTAIKERQKPGSPYPFKDKLPTWIQRLIPEFDRYWIPDKTGLKSRVRA